MLEYLENIVFEHVYFEKILSNPPQSVNKIYQAKLLRLATELKEIELSWMKEIFRWVVLAKRDLMLSEISCAVLVAQGHYDRTKENKIHGVRSILNKCGAVLQVIEKLGSPENSTVSVLHETFKHFITNSGWDGRAAQANEFLIDPDESECILTTTCLSYLMSEKIELLNRVFINETSSRFYHRGHTLFRYSALYWSKHLLQANLATEKPVPASESLINTLYKFLRREDLKNWICSVMADAANRTLPAIYDRVCRSIFSPLRDACQWLMSNRAALVTTSLPNFHHSIFEEIFNDGSTIKLEARFRHFCAAVAAESWLTVDPWAWESTICCFEIAEKRSHGIDYPSPKTQGDIEEFLSLAGEASREDKYKWFGNQAVVYLYYSSLDNGSLLAERCLRSALGSPNEGEDRLGNGPSRSEFGVSSVRTSRAETLLGKARRFPSRAGLRLGSGITRLGLAR